MEDVIHATAGIEDALVVAHITDVEFEFGMRVFFSHIILFFLVTAENADFGDVGLQKAAEDCVAEGAGAAADEEGFAFEIHKVCLSCVNLDYGQFSIGWQPVQ